jgi:hypothetical protein
MTGDLTHHLGINGLGTQSVVPVPVAERSFLFLCPSFLLSFSSAYYCFSFPLFIFSVFLFLCLQLPDVLHLHAVYLPTRATASRLWGIDGPIDRHSHKKHVPL